MLLFVAVGDGVHDSVSVPPSSVSTCISSFLTEGSEAAFRLASKRMPHMKIPVVLYVLPSSGVDVNIIVMASSSSLTSNSVNAFAQVCGVSALFGWIMPFCINVLLSNMSTGALSSMPSVQLR